MIIRSTSVRVAVAVVAAFALAVTAVPAQAAPSGGATPLVHGVEQSLSDTGLYSYTTEFIYYSVVAVRSEGGKPSVSLYSDESATTLLAASTQKKKKTDFVVVDSNHAPTGTTYYAVAKSKNGSSTIELDSDAVILFDDTPLPLAMTASDVVVSTDVLLSAGVEYTLTVQGDGNADLYLMKSGGTPETSFLSRADAVASANKKGAGKTESITITGDGDWYGVVVINSSGSGPYTLLKSPA